jgi:5-methylcytosine-specific restriction endonuclease McrA
MPVLRGCSRCGAPFVPRHARHRWCEACGPPEPSPTTRTRPSSSAERALIRAAVLKRDATCQLRLDAGCTGRSEVADHIVPAAEGGRYELSNLRGACHHCNSVAGGRKTSALEHGRDDRSSGASVTGGRSAPVGRTRLA